ncbi:MAG TPA: carbonic anhydrase [Chitinophagales bacterium]|nr:carbonic anhydrase [Chitinophagales bacterium]
MKRFETLLEDNKKWAAAQVNTDPEFFKRLENLQTPEFLWIGCSDSRVPANEITGTRPGEIFVHRNVANLVVNGDVNLLSVLKYSVEVLKVKHIIVCGHYGCGGVNAALTSKNFGVLNNWLRNIKDVYRLHQAEIDALPDTERADLLTELNVKEQVMNLIKTEIVQGAWKSDNQPHIHGCVYSLKNGILKQIISIEPNTNISPVYRLDV